MINTSFYSGIAMTLHTIAGFVVNKVIAITIGPTGVALVSQFQNFITITTSIASAGINQGVVKYVSEFRGDYEKLKEIISNSFKLAIIPSVGMGIIIIVFADFLSNYLLDNSEYKRIFQLFGISIALFACNQLLMSILNGMGEIKRFIWAKMSNSLFLLIVTSLGCYFYGLYGALLTLAVSQSIVVVFTVYFVLSSNWFKWSFFSRSIESKTLKLLLGFSLMTLTSMVLPPLVQVEIRNYIINNLSSTEAGLWDGLWKISNAYLSLITTTLGIYYLPKLSYLKGKKEIRNEIIDGYKIVVPILLISILIIYSTRDFIIQILYSSEFIEMKSLFAIQLLGDFFKIISWLIAYVMIAKAKTTMFILTQVSFSAITYFLSISLIDFLGLEGVVYAHAIKYSLYLIVVSFLLREYLFFKEK